MTSMHASPAERYRPSGRVDVARFLPWAALTLASAALAAFLLFLAYAYGYYYVVILPLAAAAYLSGLVLVSVRRGRCRSPLAALLLGLAVAIVLYPGYLWLSMFAETGIRDPTVLPAYVVWQMHSQELEVGAGSSSAENQDAGGAGEDEPEPPAPLSPFDLAFNWLLFAIEVGCVLFFCLPFGFARVMREPYCEGCGQWARRELLAFPTDSAPELLGALDRRAFAEKADQHSVAPHPNVPALLAAVDVCPCPDGSTAVWVTLKQNKGRMGMFGPFHPSETLTDRFVAPATRLDAMDAAAVVALLPSPENGAAGKAPSPLAGELAAGDAGVDALDERPASQPVARIEAVEEAFAGRILTRRNIILAQACAVGYLAAAGVALTPFVGGLTMLQDSPWSAAGIAVTSIGGLLIGGLLGLMMRHPEYLQQRYFERVVRREIARRSSPFVPAEDPDALVVEHVPRERWSRPMLDEAADLGLLSIDSERGELRFEGDRERYAIPAGAVHGVSLDAYEVHGLSSKQFTVLHVATADGVVELPLARRFTPFWRGLVGGQARAGLELFASVFDAFAPRSDDGEESARERRTR